MASDFRLQSKVMDTRGGRDEGASDYVRSSSGAAAGGTAAADADGLYGSSGFYFQHRRGRLDLRSISRLDLDRVIKNVDVEPLQEVLENLTFCSLREEDLRFLTDQHVIKMFKVAQLVIEYLLYAQEQLTDNLQNLTLKYAAKKRAVLRKRKEVAELREQSKHLREQLKTKKRGIETLENLLREAKRSGRRPVEQSPEVPKRPRPEVMKIYVCGENGLCVEFVVHGPTSIRELKREVREAFGIPANSVDGMSTYLRLMLQGRVLMDDFSIDESGIQVGDTLVVVTEKRAEEKSSKNNDEITQMMMNFVQKQQESIAGMTAEMRQGWEHVVQALATRNDSGGAKESIADLMLRTEDRWSRLESNFREMLEAKVKMQSEPIFHRRYRTGDLESDDDEQISTKLRASSTKLTVLENDNKEIHAGFRMMQDQHNRDMSEIRSLIQALQVPPKVVTIIQKEERAPPGATETPAPVIVVKEIIREVQEHPPMPQESQTPARVMASPVRENPQPEKPAPEPVPETKTQQTAYKPPKPTEKPKESKIKIDFRAITNKSLSSYIHSDKLSVVVDRDISLDDLIFEIRRAVADEADIPLARVILALRGQAIALGIDVPRGIELNAETAATMASRGELQVNVLSENPITDSQIDHLVAHYEDFGLSPTAKYAASRKTNDKVVQRSLEIYKQSLRSSKRRDYDDYERGDDAVAEEERWWSAGSNGTDNPSMSMTRKAITNGDLTRSLGDEGIAKARSSLDDMLRSLNNREGLTDEELEEETKKLRNSVQGLPDSTVSKLRQIEGRIVGAVAAATDSGSEDYAAVSNRGDARRPDKPSSLRLSGSWMSQTGGSLKLLQATSPSRSYDEYLLRAAPEEGDVPLTSSVEDVDSVSRRHVKLGSSGGGNKTAQSTVSSLDSLDIGNLGNVRKADFNSTIDTNISMPEEDHVARADRYEKLASDQVDKLYHLQTEGDDEDEDDDGDQLDPLPASPSPRKPSGFIPGSAGNVSTGSMSPFNQLNDDACSLGLSDSHDTFADLDSSTRSIDGTPSHK